MSEPTSHVSGACKEVEDGILGLGCYLTRNTRHHMRGSLTTSTHIQVIMSHLHVPEIDEETLKKLPYWKQWLYRTLKEIADNEP